MPQIIRDQDPTTTGHGCDAVTTVTGPEGANPNPVFANGIHIEAKGDPTSPHTIGPPCVPHSAVINVGSPNVFVHGIPVARQGDSTDGGNLISGSPNVFVNTKGATTAAMGWADCVLPNAPMESMFNADVEEVTFTGAEANPEPDANENGEYGDGGLGATNPRGDEQFEGNASPTTGEEGPIETPDSTPWTGDVRIVFLPHTDPGITAATQAALENVASVLDRELTITSAYRAPDYNARVGGKKGSKHMQGIAVDVVQTGWSTAERQEFIETAVAAGFNGIGIYNSFTHIDMRGSKAAWGPTGSRKSLPKVSWSIPTLQSLGFYTG